MPIFTRPPRTPKGGAVREQAITHDLRCPCCERACVGMTNGPTGVHCCPCALDEDDGVRSASTCTVGCDPEVIAWTDEEESEEVRVVRRSLEAIQAGQCITSDESKRRIHEILNAKLGKANLAR
jgi:hypothetical protein